MNLFKISSKHFSKKLPNIRKYGEFKFNFKSFLSNLPMHISNIKNRKADVKPELVEKFYIDYMKKSEDINLMRRQVNKMKTMAGDISKKGGDIEQLGKDIKKHNLDINKFSTELDEIELKLMEETIRIPNLTCPDSPVGTEEKAVIVKEVGKIRINFLN
jgi:seryl-tRNA synthetase